jgi:cation transport regulator ChaC
MTLHFAYGSNMSRPLMRARCPGAGAIGLACLSGHRFTITPDGYASVVPAAGGVVHGVLWRLTPRDLAALNAYESLDRGLYVRRQLPVRHAGRRLRALVYVATRDGAGRPRPGYQEIVLAAARDWGLPEDYVRMLARFALDRIDGNTGASAIATPVSASAPRASASAPPGGAR